MLDRAVDQLRSSGPVGPVPKLIVATIAIFILSAVTVRFAQDTESVSPLWLSNAVLLTALLRGGGGRWQDAWLLGGGALAMLLANVVAGVQLLPSVAFAAGDVVEVGIAVWLLRQFNFAASDVATTRGLSSLILLAGVIAPLVGAIPPTAAIVVAFGTSWRGTFLTAYSADALGMVIIAPLTLVLSIDQWQKIRTENRVVEAAGFLGAIVLVATMALNERAFLLLLVPIALVAAFRFGTPGAAATSAMAGIVAGVFVVSWVGTPALSEVSLAERIVALQLILAATALTALAVAAALNERDRIVVELSQAKAHAESQTRLALDAAEIGTWNLDLTTDELVLSDRVKGILGIPIAPEPSRTEVSNSIYHEDRGIFGEGLAKCLDGGDDHLIVEYRVGDPDRGPLRWVRSWGRLNRDSAGKGLRVQGVLQDVTAQKQATLERNSLLRGIIQAQEHERFRLAHDLHDQTGQDLAAVMLELKGIEYAVHEDVRERVHRLRSRLDEMSATLHRVAWELRPASIDELGLVKAIDNYVSEWGDRYQIDTDFYCNNDDVHGVSEEIGIVIFRIIQEALTNIVKHAKSAGSVSVVIRRDGSVLLTTIEDNGGGFDLDLVNADMRSGNGGTLGLVGMRERLALIGGEMEIESSAGAGTTVFARMKLEPARMMT